MMVLRIGELAARTNTSRPTIRYYESIGLLPPARRMERRQRCYAETDVERLTLIRRMRAFGFSIDQVRTLVSVLKAADRSCLEARDLAQEHLEALRGKLRELRALERDLAAFIRDCDRSCPGGSGPDCVMFRTLADRPWESQRR